MEGEWETTPKLSNDTSFNNLELPVTFKVTNYLAPNNLKMVQDRAVVTMADQ